MGMAVVAIHAGLCMDVSHDDRAVAYMEDLGGL